MILKRFVVFISFVFVALFLASCNSNEYKFGKKHKRHNLQGAINFPKIKDARLDLEIVSYKKDFSPGSEGKITFRLKNKGSKVKIYEWMMKDSDNVKIYYRSFVPGLEKFDPKDWTLIEPDIQEPRYSCLELNANNSAFVDKKLPFIKNISASSLPAEGKKYYVLGELNLKSVSARSRPIVITVK
jgi:hypothetical protein